MKKFDRLPLRERKEEIQAAAMKLFQEKGFAATTMENIVQAVTLSKGGVYRIYPSTAAILSDLILCGMRLRNAYYEKRVRQLIADGQSLTLGLLVDMVADSLLLYPNFSAVYVEFLWEKQRNPDLEALYQQICDTTVEETKDLMLRYGADALLPESGQLQRLTDLMNAAVLSLQVLGLQEGFEKRKDLLCSTIVTMLQQQNK